MRFDEPTRDWLCYLLLTVFSSTTLFGKNRRRKVQDHGIGPLLASNENIGVRTTTPTLQRLARNGRSRVLHVQLRAHATGRNLESVAIVIFFCRHAWAPIRDVKSITRPRLVHFWSTTLHTAAHAPSRSLVRVKLRVRVSGQGAWGGGYVCFWYNIFLFIFVFRGGRGAEGGGGGGNSAMFFGSVALVMCSGKAGARSGWWPPIDEADLISPSEKTGLFTGCYRPRGSDQELLKSSPVESGWARGCWKHNGSHRVCQEVLKPHRVCQEVLKPHGSTSGHLDPIRPATSNLTCESPGTPHRLVP